MRMALVLPVLLLGVLPLGGACQARPTLQQPRPLSAPFTSAARVFDLWLSPHAIARDTGELSTGAVRLVRGELDFGTAGKTAKAMLGEPPQRIGAAVASTRKLTSHEIVRLGDLRRSPGWSALDPRPDLVDLADDTHRLGQYLHVDQRALGEPDDREHRVDPADDRPEAGWLPRILRRILP
jgi:hypothetical protein